MIFGAHEISPEDDIDWTVHRDDWNEEQRARESRNQQIKARLMAGDSVQYSSTGNSLWPIVCSGDCCMFEPVTAASVLKENDVVFCEVQPKGYFYAHKILKIKWNAAGVAQKYDRWFVIGNQAGRENGWCYKEHIYGRLVEISRAAETAASAPELATSQNPERIELKVRSPRQQ